MTTKAIDYAGIAISTLCIVHCILLPLATSTLPIVGMISENEIVHKVLVLLAVIPAAFVFASSIGSRFSLLIRLIGVTGIATLFLGAFVEWFHDYETVLTLVGATCLASAHIFRLLDNRPHSHNN